LPVPTSPSPPPPPPADCPAGFFATSLSPLPQPGHLITWPVGCAGTSIAVPQVGHFTILAIRKPQNEAVDVRSTRTRRAGARRRMLQEGRTRVEKVSPHLGRLCKLLLIRRDADAQHVRHRAFAAIAGMVED